MPRRKRGRPKKTSSDYHKLANQRPDILAWLGPEVEYISKKTWWQCAICNKKWEARYNTIQQGYKCFYCSKGQKPPIAEAGYITLAKKKGIKFIGPMVRTTKIKTRWQCKCGNIWLCTYSNISKGRSCSNCAESEGESLIAQTLIQLKIKHKREYTFDKCRSAKGRLLFFDFVVFLKTNLCIIEYDGAHHFRPIEYYGGKKKFEIVTKHDQIKNRFAKKHDMPLLRIPYHERDNIKSIVTKWIRSLQS